MDEKNFELIKEIILTIDSYKKEIVEHEIDKIVGDSMLIIRTVNGKKEKSVDDEIKELKEKITTLENQLKKIFAYG